MSGMYVFECLGGMLRSLNARNKEFVGISMGSHNWYQKIYYTTNTT
jgi:hypothetical protein